MKQGNICHLSVKFDGIDADDIQKVIFLFSQSIDSQPLKTALYVNSGPISGDVLLDEDGVFQVPFSSDDTYLFKSGTVFYMDTRIFRVGNVFQDNPETHIVTLRMEPTLFYWNDHPSETTGSGEVGT